MLQAAAYVELDALDGMGEEAVGAEVAETVAELITRHKGCGNRGQVHVGLHSAEVEKMSKGG